MSMMFITPDICKHNTYNTTIETLQTQECKVVKMSNKEAAVSAKLPASATIEAALVIPIFIYAVMSVMYFIQVMAIRAHVNDALYTTLKKCAGYAYIYENYNEHAGEMALDGGIADKNTVDVNGGGIKKGMVVETIRRIFIKELGSDYASRNNIVNGDAGFIFISTKVLQGNSVIDIKVSYYIKNPYDVFGASKIKIADRKRINAWLGEDKDGFVSTQNEQSEYVYITAGGEVYHTDSQCTHLLRYIKECLGSDIEKLRNSSGAKYYQCQVCRGYIGADGNFNKTDNTDNIRDSYNTGNSAGESDETKITVYYTEYGTRYHSNSMCTELRRNIQKVKKSSVADRRLCDKCNAGK